MITKLEEFIKKIDYKVFGLITIVEFLIYQFSLIPHLSPDSYPIADSQIYFIKQLSSQGRGLTSLFVNFINNLGINLVSNQVFFTIIEILLFSFSTYLIYDCFVRINKKASILIIICSLLVTSQLLTVDMFFYSFMSIAFSLSLLLVVIALHVITKEVNARNILITFLLLCCSVLFYQSWIEIFVGLGIVHLFLQRKINLTSIIVLLTSQLGAILIDFMYIKFIHPIFFSLIDVRAAVGNPIENLKIILDFQPKLWIDYFGFLPPYLFIGFLIFTIVFIIILFIQKKQIRDIYLPLLIVVLVVGISFSFHLFGSNIWITPRSIIGIGSLIGILVLLLINQYNKLINLWVFLLSIFLILNIISLQRISSDTLQVNNLDQAYFEDIEKQITLQEKSTHQKVDQIEYYLEPHPMGCYPNIKCIDDLNIRVVTKLWTIQPAFIRYTGKYYELHELKSKGERHIKNNIFFLDAK